MKVKYLLIASLLSVVGLFGVTSVAHAEWSQNAVTGDNVTLAKDKEHKGAFYAAGSTVKIEGNVDGDVYCAGETVEVTGSVTGSVLCAGKSVRVSGSVGRDVRVAGQTVTIDGKVAGAVSAFAQNATVSQSATVAGELNGAAQNIRIEGPVGQNVRMGAEEIVIGAAIAGNVDVGVNNLIINDHGKVGGNVNYGAEKQLDLPQDKIGGKVSYNKPPESEKRSSTMDLFTGMLMVTLALFVSAMLLATAIPRFMQHSAEVAQKGIVYVVLTGLAALFSTPFVIFFLAMTLVGIPFAIVLGMVWVTVLLLSGAFFSYWVGSMVLRRSNNILARMAVGTLITIIASMLPYGIGVFVVFVVLILGSGILIRAATSNYPAPNYRVVPVQPPAQRNETRKKPAARTDKS